MTGWAVAALVLAFATWRVRAYKRRLRAAAERLAHFHAKADERAARAVLRPRTGHVATSSVRPPITTNGRP